MNELGKDRAKKLAKLATAKGRREQGFLLLDSAPLVERALDLGLVEELFFDEHRGPEVQAQAERAAAADVFITATDADHLAKICGVQTPAGLAALIPRLAAPELADIAGQPELSIVFLEKISDPGNLGTIARNAAAFGCDLLVVSEGSADPESPKAMRASAGSLLSLPCARLSLEDLRPLIDEGVTLLRTVVQGGETLTDLPAIPRRILWLGNEAEGASAAPDNMPSRDVTIAMQRPSESINVASAAAIFLQAMEAKI